MELLKGQLFHKGTVWLNLTANTLKSVTVNLWR